jgi:hypothetical protein
LHCVLPKLLQQMVEDCWSADPSKRGRHLKLYSNSVQAAWDEGRKEQLSNSSVIDRSTHLMDRSLRSLAEDRNGIERDVSVVKSSVKCGNRLISLIYLF